VVLHISACIWEICLVVIGLSTTGISSNKKVHQDDTLGVTPILTILPLNTIYWVIKPFIYIQGFLGHLAKVFHVVQIILSTTSSIECSLEENMNELRALQIVQIVECHTNKKSLNVFPFRNSPKKASSCMNTSLESTVITPSHLESYTKHYTQNYMAQINGIPIPPPPLNTKRNLLFHFPQVLLLSDAS
jgi:hypothetical protein